MEIFYVLTIVLFSIAVAAAIIIMKITYDAEIKLKKVSEKISDGYVIFNKFGKVTNYNSTFLKIFNFQEKSVNRKSIKSVISRIVLDDVDVNRILNALDSIEEKKYFEFNIIRNDRTLKLEVMSLVDNDIFMRYVIIVKDITKNYKMIEDIKENQEMLANRERFATLRWANNWNCTFLKISNFYYNRRT